MSKNGKLLFKDYDPYITSGFGERIHPITKKKTMFISPISTATLLKRSENVNYLKDIK